MSVADAAQAEAPGAGVEAEAEVDDGDEAVAVDDAVDPGHIGVAAGARGAPGEGVAAVRFSGGGDHGAGFQALRVRQAEGAERAGEVEAEVELEPAGGGIAGGHYSIRFSEHRLWAR